MSVIVKNNLFGNAKHVIYHAKLALTMTHLDGVIHVINYK